MLTLVGQAPIPDATATYDGTTATTDSNGEVALDLTPNEAFEVVFSKADYRDYIWRGEVAGADFSAGPLWPDNATLGGLSARSRVPL